jgi:type VI secretion system secreted protein VgrG
MLNIPTANALQEAASSMVSQGLGELLAQFTAAFKQTNRLLRLHTPLGANVLLAESLKGIETISGAAPSAASDITGYQLQIDALSTNAHLQLKALIGQPVLLEIQTDQSRDVLRPLHGHVTAAVAIGSNGGMARYRLTVQPWLAFLGAGRDSAVFQDMSVLTIVQSILTDYQSTLQGQGKLQALWRLDVQDAAAYPIRSLTTQYQESDLQFINRLLAEEGLFYWFEHTGDPANASLGSHTLVIADHNGAFKPLQRGKAGASIRFSQSKGVIADDTIDLWSPQSSWGTHAVDIASWDYRSLSVRPVSEHAGDPSANPEGTPALTIQDTPGAYAYENAAQGQRLARNHSQALQVARHSLQAAGTVRALAPGQTFSLTGHASSPTGTDTATPEHVVLHVIHHARNNLSAQLKATSATLPSSPSSALDKLIGSNAAGNTPQDTPQDIFYRNAALVLPVDTAYRASRTNGHGQLIHPKPSANGSQTALVIGVAGQHLSTDRDHRVKVQFAWQRGASSQSRLSHPAADGHSGAPADDGTQETTGTWVRVATPLAPIAGANWGSVALPRIGQEVLVTFLGGDIDRPVIIASLYNGQGADNAQTNQVQQGAANATGNAPMWFPGDQEANGKQGKLPGHAHNAVLSGIKTQALSASQTGQGGYNQIVFDDSPGQSRLGLQSHAKQAGSHAGETELNLGALRQQTDNQRLGSVGYGFELKTHFSGAIRSGSGLLISADKRSGNESGSSSHQMDSKEAASQLQTGQDLIKALTETAQQHKAMLPVLKTTEVKPDKLPVMMSFAQMGKSLQALDVRDAGATANAQSDAGNDEDSQAEKKFDEQLVFVNAKGAPLKNVSYEVMLADGSKHSGTTDANGRTSRITTETPQAVQEVTLKAKETANCCAAHAKVAGDETSPITFAPQGVATNEKNIGSSTQQVSTPKGKSRGLTAGEIAMARQVFKDAIDYSRVKVHNGEYLWFGMQGNDTAMTPNGEMYFNPKWFVEDFSVETPGMQHWFMHEMTHVWQYQLGFTVKLHGLISWAVSYKYKLKSGRSLADESMEPQGDLLADYFVLKFLANPAAMVQGEYATELALFESDALPNFIANPASKDNLPGGNGGKP